MRLPSVVVLVVVLVAVLLSECAGVRAAQDCQGKVGTFNYDLSPLSAAQVTTKDPNGQQYTYRPCNNLAAICSFSGDQVPAICQKDGNGDQHDCGSQNQVSWSQRTDGGAADQGFALAFSGGEASRKAIINFKCDQNAGNGEWTFKAENPTHTYAFEWTTKHACPGGGGGGGGGGDDGLAGGWIFIIVLSCLVVVYLVGGVAYNKFHAKREGIELIPNVSFWMALPGLVKDGHLYTFNKARGLVGGRGYEEM